MTVSKREGVSHSLLARFFYAVRVVQTQMQSSHRWDAPMISELGHIPLQAHSIFPPKGERGASWDASCIRGVQEAPQLSSPSRFASFRKLPSNKTHKCWGAPVFPASWRGSGFRCDLCARMCRPAETLSETTAHLSLWSPAACFWSDCGLYSLVNKTTDSAQHKVWENCDASFPQCQPRKALWVFLSLSLTLSL